MHIFHFGGGYKCRSGIVGSNPKSLFNVLRTHQTVFQSSCTILDSLSCVQLFVTPWTNSPWNSPGQNTGVGSCSLLQGIFPTQGSNPGLPHCRQIFYQLSCQGSILHSHHARMPAKLLLTLCDPMEYSLPGSLVHGNLQARILEWHFHFSLSCIGEGRTGHRRTDQP